VNSLGARRLFGGVLEELGGPGATEFDHPSRTYRGDGRYRGPTLHRSRLIRYPDAPRNRSEEASPLRDGVLALAFHTLLSFQGTSPGCSSATHLRFPRPVTAGAAGRYHGPFKIVKDFPPARSAYSWGSTTCHVDTFTQKRRPAPRPSGRQDGHRTAVGSNPLGVRRPPVFRCRRRWRRSGEVLGPEELPCLQLGEGSTGFDSVSTWLPRLDPRNHNGSSAADRFNGRGRSGIPGPAVRARAPAAAPGRGGRR
jgi:hypothetical protein